MTAGASLMDRLRDQILSGLHLGHLKEGDRLPSTRQVAADTGTDARAVARAYRGLEAEGLIEVRARSGIYVAAGTHEGGTILVETTRWAARVLADGWKRGIGFPELPGFFGRCVGRRQVRCAFVESSEDVMTAFTHELRELLGVEVQPVWADSVLATPRDEESIPRAVREADLVITTSFHARKVRLLTEALGKPLIAATLNPMMVGAVERQIQNGGLVVICADPRFGERIRTQYAALLALGHRIRIVHADDAAGIGALDPTEPVLLTRAARQRLPELDLPLVVPHSPTLAAATVLEVAGFVVRANLES